MMRPGYRGMVAKYRAGAGLCRVEGARQRHKGHTDANVRLRLSPFIKYITLSVIRCLIQALVDAGTTSRRSAGCSSGCSGGAAAASATSTPALTSGDGLMACHAPVVSLAVHAMPGARALGGWKHAEGGMHTSCVTLHPDSRVRLACCAQGCFQAVRGEDTVAEEPHHRGAVQERPRHHGLGPGQRALQPWGSERQGPAGRASGPAKPCPCPLQHSVSAQIAGSHAVIAGSHAVIATMAASHLIALLPRSCSTKVFWGRLHGDGVALCTHVKTVGNEASA